VTGSGQLTGMCCIEDPFPWYQLKDEWKTLFRWLKDKVPLQNMSILKKTKSQQQDNFLGCPQMC